jgi:hypothetical protein
METILKMKNVTAMHKYIQIALIYSFASPGRIWVELFIME